MRIMVMGGAGLEGTELARDLVRSKVDEIIIADCNLHAAEGLAKQLSAKGGSRVTAQFIDANDHSGTVKAIREAKVDAVANTIGPFYMYGPKVVKIAVDARVPYVDINDEFKPTRKILSDYDAPAKEAGIPVLLGCGASPGCTNLLAAYGASKLTRADKINIEWLWPSTGDGSGVAAVLHFLEIITGDCVQFLDGEFKAVPAGTEIKEVEFPPLGKNQIAYVGHAEPETLPRFIRGVNEVTCHGGAFPAELAELAYYFKALGLTATEPLNVNGQEIVPRTFSMALIDKLMSELGEALAGADLPSLGFIKVHVTGQKDDAQVTYSYYMSERPDGMTANPASIAVQMAAQGRIKRTGVFAPEGLDIELIKEMLDQLKKRGYSIHEKEQIERQL